MIVVNFSAKLALNGSAKATSPLTLLPALAFFATTSAPRLTASLFGPVTATKPFAPFKSVQTLGIPTEAVLSSVVTVFSELVEAMAIDDCKITTLQIANHAMANARTMGWPKDFTKNSLSFTRWETRSVV
jgi:hypothetical protein